MRTLRLSMSSRCSLRYGVLRLVLRVCPFQVGRPTAREASWSGARARANGRQLVRSTFQGDRKVGGSLVRSLSQEVNGVDGETVAFRAGRKILPRNSISALFICEFLSPSLEQSKNKLVYHVDGGGGNGYADLLSSLRDGNFRSHLVRLDILAGQRGHNSSAIPRIRRGRPAKPMQEREAGERRERKSAM
jgi:hypothetical protein